ncbi:pimeloyl-ACP methyl ester esterase BioH [Leeia oryzae]|uniref:pimeloyl-ACP methyl ester esterase BioH n=1 Tax=Leeia oryzae TaxID=356662 RepID=UPI000375B9BE|nr:pimeloyl-ACP methyl ester esterase BioH [Leeia oryzae]
MTRLHIDTLPHAHATPGKASPELVLLHGWGMHGQVWGEFATRLSELATVHVIDLPGHGHSGHTDPFDLASMAEAVQHALPQPAIWMGWSLGGMVAQYVALHHPDSVLGLGLIASSPCFTTREDWPNAMKPQVLSQFTDELASDAEATLHRFLALQAMGSPSARTQVVQLKQALSSRPLAHQDTLTGGLHILRDADLRHRLHQITCPVELIYGERDALVPAATARWLAETLPHARLHLLAQSAHAPFLTHPEVCLDAARQLILQSDSQ